MSRQSGWGLPAVLGALSIWGFIPLYFKLLQGVPSIEIVAYRALWILPLCLLFLWATRRTGELKAIFANRRVWPYLALSSLFIAGNWLFFVLAVMSDNVLGASFGYFINPLFTVFLASVVLRERLSRLQWLAIVMAAIAVLVLAAGAWDRLWISLAIAGSWAGYSLSRRLADVAAIPGMTLEAAILAPVFGCYLLFIKQDGSYAFGTDLRLDLLLMGAAGITLLSLILFNIAVTRLGFATLGVVQFLPPTVQFLLGWLVFGEALTWTILVCFAIIWISLCFYTWEAVRLERVRRRALPI